MGTGWYPMIPDDRNCFQDSSKEEKKSQFLRKSIFINEHPVKTYLALIFWSLLYGLIHTKPFQVLYIFSSKRIDVVLVSECRIAMLGFFVSFLLRVAISKRRHDSVVCVEVGGWKQNRVEENTHFVTNAIVRMPQKVSYVECVLGLFTHHHLLFVTRLRRSAVVICCQ